MSTSSSSCEFLEHVTTPMNACSLEALPDPIQLGQSSSNGKWVWPLMLGCYELDESQGQRKGHLDLYAVPVPQDQDPRTTIPAGLGNPMTVLGDGVLPTSGILDGKWCPQRKSSNSSGSKEEALYYATAHASGEILVHKVETAAQDNSMNSDDEPFQVSQAGKSEPYEESSALCLALSWDLNAPDDDSSSSSTRIVSSYSDGHVAIHEVAFHEDGTVQLQEQESWAAHKMFQCPAEVWSASFVHNTPHVVLSGGDEGALKVWDLRVGTASAIHTFQHTFQAGVTVIAPHPRRDHLVACGSYDETVALFDLRSVSQSKPKPLCHSEPLGGGMWRIKWHPRHDDRLLLGAMHGGCRVVKVDGLVELLDDYNSDSPTGVLPLQVQQKFTNHESMAYGADWLVCQTKTGRLVQAAVSCSFYDNALYLWNVNS